MEGERLEGEPVALLVAGAEEERDGRFFGISVLFLGFDCLMMSDSENCFVLTFVDDVFSETDLAFECVDDECDSETMFALDCC